MNKQELLDFQQLFQAYAAERGHTFSTFCLFPGSDAFENARQQMQQCLTGDRPEPVTQESIGQTGEGIRDEED